MSIANSLPHADQEDDLQSEPSGRTPGTPVKWYRPKLSREQMSALNRKSDLLGFAQTLGYLLTITATGTLAVWGVWHLPWYLTLLAFFLHGTCCNFLINGFHELVHESIFKTRWLNGFFLRIFSFLGWYNHTEFWASHTEHHKFTLHPPDDLEVVLPQHMKWQNLLKGGFIDYMGVWHIINGTVRVAMGRVEGQWMNHLFPPDKPALRRARANWARLLLVGHGLIIATSIVTGYWPIAIAASFCRLYGGIIQFYCNAAQHIGLQDNVSDFRLCCRTIYLNPLLRFLYWHMNYHTEHHMYAGVPCYRLGQLNALIRHEMPECPRGLIATWIQIYSILKRQKSDPTYQFVPALPQAVHPLGGPLPTM